MYVIIWYLPFSVLTSLRMIISRSNHVTANGIISFFLWLSNIPSRTHARVCVCVHIYTHLFHSSVDRHLGCFHVLAIVSSAVVNTGVHVPF